jgi:hypothetical protein
MTSDTKPFEVVLIKPKVRLSKSKSQVLPQQKKDVLDCLPSSFYGSARRHSSRMSNSHRLRDLLFRSIGDTRKKKVALFSKPEDQMSSIPESQISSKPEGQMIRIHERSAFKKQVFLYFFIGEIFWLIIVACSVTSVSFIICMLTLLLMHLAGLHFCVGLDFVTPLL